MTKSALNRRAFLRRATLLAPQPPRWLSWLPAASSPSTAALVKPSAAPADGATTDAPAAAMTDQVQGVLRAALDTPVKLDPAFASSDSEIAVLNNVYDYLVDVDHQSKIQPRLAQAWKISDDGLIYTFTLAPNVTFHDGSPLTARDVV